MKLYLDTSNIDEINKANELGLLDGVTTNPTTLSKVASLKDYRKTWKEICTIVNGPVSAEVISTDTAGMVKEGREISKIAKNIVIKIPMTTEGLKAIRILTKEGIRVNTTLIFSPIQALLAAKAGATYVSPFVGRLDDIGHDGMQVVADTVQIFRNYSIKTQVLAASLRHPMHVVQAAMAGADIATMPYAVFEKLPQHVLTDKGLKMFLDDWAKIRK